MPTIFDQLIANLKAAQGDTAQLALVTLDFAVSADPILREAAEVAAIPHWFDAETLAALLPEHAGRADCLLEQLRALPMVEPYNRRDGKNAYNLHEATRLAVRDRLLASDPERFRTLSQRAAAAYGSADPDAPDFVLTCEHLYHQLAGQTDEGDAAMAKVAGQWRIGFRTERLQTLALLLEELLAAKPAPPLLQRGKGQAYLNIAAARENHQPKPLTRDLTEKAEAIFQLLAKSDPANAEWQRDLSVSHAKLGDLAVAQGDLPGAMRRFTDALAIAERLAASDPANAAWQRDLSLSHNKLGDLAVAQGDLPGAMRRFTDSLQRFERLAASDPANAEWQRDLSISHDRLGKLAVAQGDLPGAMRHHTVRLAIAERLAASDPANAEWQRDLFISWSKVSDVAVAQGDLSKAQQAYEQVLGVNQRLAASDPANAEWQRDLSISHDRLGKLAVAQGDLPGAMGRFTDSLAIAERLAASDPANAEWQRDLSVSHDRLGDLAVAQGDLPGAMRRFTDSLAIRERLAASDPANAERQRDLSVSYVKLADLSEKDSKPADAKGWWRKAHDTLASMKQRGLHLSPEDEGFLDWLRAKLAQ